MVPSQTMKRLRIGLALLVLAAVIALTGMTSSASAAVYYIGQFDGSSPLDDSDCGGGIGSHPNGHPCATLAYWTQNKQSILRDGDIVRIATGTYGPSSNVNHCIMARANVTYEGRNADDSQASDPATVVIDTINTPNSYPCFAKPIVCDGCSFGNFRLRSITLQGGTNPYSCVWMKPSSPSDGFEMRYMRVTGCHAGPGFVIGDTACPSPGATCRRYVTNLIVDHSEFDNNAGDGLYLGAVDGFTISNTAFHDNGDGYCGPPNTSSACKNTDSCPGDCQDDDGLNITAAMNGMITDSHAYNNRQYGFDFTRTGSYDNCDGSTHSIITDRAYSHDNGYASYSFSGCANDITIRNSFAWGHGTGLNLYYGACGLKFYNNTIYMNGGRALFSFSLHTDLDMRNNIFSTSSSSSTVALTSSITQQNNGSLWDGNIVVNKGSGSAISIFTPSPDTSSEMSSDPDYACTSLGSPQGNGSSFSDSASGLSSWQNTHYFGQDTGSHDRWGTEPTFVNAINPGVANLHLDSSDTVARDKGLNLTLFSEDYDQNSRLQDGLWDIGADEFSQVTSTLAAPKNLKIIQ